MKNKRNFVWVLMLCVWLLTLPVLAGETTSIVIIHWNDFHGNLNPELKKNIDPDNKIGGLAYVTAYVQALKKIYPHYLILDAGDFAQGTPISNLCKGKPVIEAYNYIGVSAGTMGNHEFDYGQSAIKDFNKWAKYPILCSNVVYEKDPGRILCDMKPYQIFPLGDIKVGVLGMLTPETPTITKAENVAGLKFLDPVETAGKYVPLMKSQGADIIVMLSHMGLEEDTAFAKKFKGVDVIVGGHSHSTVMDPKKVENTLIVQAGCYGRYVGKLVIQYDKEQKKIVYATPNNQLITTLHYAITPDPEVSAIIKNYEEQMGSILKEPVGVAEVDLVRSAGKNHQDWNIGNLICDAMRDKTQADVSIYNPGGIRAEILQGEITYSDVYRVLPFDNTVVTMGLTGSQIKQVLEHGAQGGGSVQVSGITFSIDYNKAVGDRISDLLIGGQPVDLQKEYKVSTIDFLLTGGDGFVIFKEGKNIVYGDNVRELVKTYIKMNTPIRIKPDQRIKIIGAKGQGKDY